MRDTGATFEKKEKVLGIVLAEKVTEYFSDQSHREAFEEWYMKKYGKPYKWKY